MNGEVSEYNSDWVRLEEEIKITEQLAQSAKVKSMTRDELDRAINQRDKLQEEMVAFRNKCGAIKNLVETYLNTNNVGEATEELLKAVTRKFTLK